MHKNLPCVRFSCKILIHLFTKVCIVRQGLSISSLFLILMVGCIKAGYSLQLKVIFIGHGYRERQEVWQLSKWHKQRKYFWYTATWIKTPVKLKWQTLFGLHIWVLHIFRPDLPHHEVWIADPGNAGSSWDGSVAGSHHCRRHKLFSCPLPCLFIMVIILRFWIFLFHHS